MTEAGPTRSSADLADVVELLLDKGLVVNADIAVSIGDTELLGIRVRAAVASFETAAQYGLEFPEGTDRERIEQVANRGRLADAGDSAPARTTDVSIARPTGERPDVDASSGGSSEDAASEDAAADASAPRPADDEGAAGSPDGGDASDEGGAPDDAEPADEDGASDEADQAAEPSTDDGGGR